MGPGGRDGQGSLETCFLPLCIQDCGSCPHRMLSRSLRSSRRGGRQLPRPGARIQAANTCCAPPPAPRAMRLSHFSADQSGLHAIQLDLSRPGRFLSQHVLSTCYLHSVLGRIEVRCPPHVSPGRQYEGGSSRLRQESALLPFRRPNQVFVPAWDWTSGHTTSQDPGPCRPALARKEAPSKFLVPSDRKLRRTQPPAL